MSKMDVEVTLLSKEEVEGKSKVLQSVGRGCEIAYWTSTPSYFYDSYANRYAYGFRVHGSGELRRWGPVDSGFGVRPVLRSDNLELLITTGCMSKTKGDIQIVEYGEYPHLTENVKIMNETLLKKTGKNYILPCQGGKRGFYTSSFPEYDYNGQKVIKIGHYYYPVKPVTWYVDRENSMLISTEVLFESPINVNNDKYKGDFEISQLYEFLNTEFIKDLNVERVFDEQTPNPYFSFRRCR